MAATATQTKPPRFGDAMLDDNKPIQPITQDRFVSSAHIAGDKLFITLPNDEKIDEGEQDIARWRHAKLVIGQWLEVSNDAESMWRLMRVARVYGTAASGLRALVLRDIVPPQFSDRANEPITATGEWYFRWAGQHRQWVVVQPNGNVRFEGLNSQEQARIITHNESGNPRAP